MKQDLGKRYKEYSTYLKEVFQGRVQKLSIDAGFTCPNRDGTKGTGGCTFCNNDSFAPEYCRKTKSITEQIEEGILFFDRKYNGQKYLAYFQTYSNTYAPLEILKEKYEEALSHPKIVGLVIGTRPDVISEDVLVYLENLAKNIYICIEYGVESLNNNVLSSINRGHSWEDSQKAIYASANRNIIIGAHLILGLPGESHDSMLQGAIKLSKLPVDILKLHQLQIITDTRIAQEYENNPTMFNLFTMEEYLDTLINIIEKIHPDIYLERFVNQAPAEYLLAPKWGVRNHEFTAKLDKRLSELDTWQGKKYKD